MQSLYALSQPLYWVTAAAEVDDVGVDIEVKMPLDTGVASHPPICQEPPLYCTKNVIWLGFISWPKVAGKWKHMPSSAKEVQDRMILSARRGMYR